MAYQGSFTMQPLHVYAATLTTQEDVNYL